MIKDEAREQRIEIATRLMESWMRSWNHDVQKICEIEAKAMAKICARAALKIQQEA